MSEARSGSRPGSNQTQPAPLLPRISRGDKAAVTQFMDRYGGLVWSLARRLTWNEADAEDAVQEIFVDLWKSAARFDPGVASEITFVAMIARRRLIDRRRRASRRPEMQVIPESVAADSELPEDGVEVSQEAGIALSALTQLSTEQQRVLRLSIFQGLSHEKIAKATGLPLGTVKTHARRGLIRIRQLLEDQNQDAGTAAAPGEVAP